MRLLRTYGLPAALLTGGLFMSPAHAADVVTAPPESPPNEWTFSVAPYFWMAGIDGSVGIFGREPVDIDMSFGDIIQDLKFGGMAVAELHNGTWGVFGDIIYVKTEADGSVTQSIAGVPTSLAASVGTSSFTGTFMGEYRAYSTPVATIDLMAGIRVWDVDN